MILHPAYRWSRALMAGPSSCEPGSGVRPGTLGMGIRSRKEEEEERKEKKTKIVPSPWTLYSESLVILTTWFRGYFSYCGRGAVKYLSPKSRLSGRWVGIMPPDW